MKVSNLLNLLLMGSLLGLIGCSAGLDESGDTQNSVSTFYASKVSSATKSIQISENSEWSIPTVRKLTLKTCLKDMAYGKSIVAQNFEVVGKEITESAISDESGCIEWNDFVRYDYLAQEKEIQLTRRVKGLGDYTGQLNLTFKVNPWSGEIIDTRSSISSEKFVSALSINASEKNLEISKVSIEFGPQKHNVNNAQVTANISFKPLLRRYSISGKPVLEAITSGNFDLALQIFEKINGEFSPMTSISEVNGTLVKDEFREDITFNFLKPRTKGSSLLLSVQLIPNRTTAPKSLTDAAGHVVLARLEGLDGGTFVSEEIQSPYYQALKNAKNTGGPDQAFGLSVDSLSVYFDGFTDEHNGTAAVKKIRSKVIACIQNNLTKELARETEFEVSFLNENNELIVERAKKTKANGCFETFYEEEFNINKSRISNYVPQFIQVVGLENSLEGATALRKFYINPYETNKFAHTNEDEEPHQFDKVQDAKLYVSGVRVSYRSNDETKYRLNTNLDLSFVKEFRVEFAPQIDRGHMMNGEKRPDSLYSGKLNMRFMILAPKYNLAGKTIEQLSTISKVRAGAMSRDLADNYTFITGTEQIVKVERDGNVKADALLKFNTNNAKYLSSKTYAVIEISAIDEENEVQAAVFTSPVMLSATVGSKESLNESTMSNIKVSQLELNNELNKQFAKIKDIDLEAAPKSNWKLESFDLFEKLLEDGEKVKTIIGRDNLTYKTWESISGYSAYRREVTKNLITKEEFDYIMNKDKGETDMSVKADGPRQWLQAKNKMVKTLQAKLCYYFFRDQNVVKGYNYNWSDEETCKINPSKFLSFKGVKFVMDITKQPTKSKGSRQGSLSMSTGNNTDISTRWNEYWGWRLGWGFKIGTGALEAIGLSASGGFDMNYGQGWSNNEGTGERVSFGESQRLDHEEFVLDFEAKTRSCILVKDLKNGKGLRLCDKDDVVETITEHWYFINEPWRRLSYIADPGAKNEMRIFKLIRGRTKFARFKDLIEAANNELFLTPVSPRTELNQFLAPLYESNAGEIPTLARDHFPGILE